MSQREPPKPLEDFDARLRRAKAEGRSPDTGREDGAAPPAAGIGMALRISTELVAALIVGVGIGLLLDRWLETAPWFLVVFIFIGAGAGILNVYRAANRMGLSVGYAKPRAGDEAAAREEKEDHPVR